MSGNRQWTEAETEQLKALFAAGKSDAAIAAAVGRSEMAVAGRRCLWRLRREPEAPSGRPSLLQRLCQAADALLDALNEFEDTPSAWSERIQELDAALDEAQKAGYYVRKGATSSTAGTWSGCRRCWNSDEPRR